MVDKYIRKQDAIDAVEQANGNITWVDRDNCKKRLEDLPPADVALVVRCKDCKFCCRNDAQDWYWCERGLVVIKVRLNDFCSYGERREG